MSLLDIYIKTGEQIEELIKECDRRVEMKKLYRKKLKEKYNIIAPDDTLKVESPPLWKDE